MLVAGISTTIHTIFQGEGTLLTMPNTFWIEVARAEYLHSTIVSKTEMKCPLRAVDSIGDRNTLDIANWRFVEYEGFAQREGRLVDHGLFLSPGWLNDQERPDCLAWLRAGSLPAAARASAPLSTDRRTSNKQVPRSIIAAARYSPTS
jgi:hypothetical protein